MDYSKHIESKNTSQTSPIPGSTQVQNSAGGFSWAVDMWKQLDRFLVLGTEGGSYYATERKLTKDNVKAIEKCIKANGLRTISRIVEVSDAGRAPKNDPAIFALAACAKLGDEATRRAAYLALPRVCRIGTHLFHFVQFAEALAGESTGWGNGMKRAVARWYDERSVADLAYQAVKYQQRDGWSHRDLLRLSKPRHAEGNRDWLYHWIVKGEAASLERHLSAGGKPGTSPFDCDELKFVHAFEQAKTASTVQETIRLITDARLPRECVRPEHLNAPEVWDALLPHMKPEALIRNLAKMTAVGLIKPMSVAEALVARLLSDEHAADRFKKARLHPIKVLAAMLTYASGHGVRGSLTWTPSPRIIDALDKAFYLAFGAVESTSKRTMLALDVSGSMDGGEIAGVPGLTPRIGSSAMALITAATEPNHMFTAFTNTGRRSSMHYGYAAGLSPLTISPRMRINDVMRTVSSLQMGGTDCALPMIYAQEQKLSVDTFVVYTDSETWAGKPHPSQALKQYRQATGIAAKLVVVGMVANEFTIADPNDAGMLDVVGFDTAAPQVIADFSKEAF